jgi:hypothetical protein
MKTYTVKANDFLLGVRLPRKRAVDLIFAACVAAGEYRSRETITWELGDENPQRPLVEVDLPTGVLIESYRDDA